MIRIKDIYAGKPDANDEIRERGFEEFANSYITPSGINISKLGSTIYGTPYFIMGDKGTGKTALLHYLEKYTHTLDDSACSSFLSFEKDISPIEKQKMTAISNAVSTMIKVDNNIASTDKNTECDFTYVWRWQFYQKIINDNENFSSNLFIDDGHWDEFKKEVFKIDKTIKNGKMHIPAKVTVSVTANPQLGTITPSLSIQPVDFSQSDFYYTDGYKKFVEIIDRADELIKYVKRTDIPYYIFIDELEAYRGEGGIFFRDLRMIRDLLFTVKRLNDEFQSGTKLICSVRLEILNSINRFVQSNQLHKIMQGFDDRLLWEFTNTNSFKHPIMSIFLKRIEMAEIEADKAPISNESIIRKWFSARLYNTDICTYILDNTWHKPRDIVRLILAAQSKNSKENTMFNQSTFDIMMPEYSRQCLVEVKEEMRALYTTEEIDCIVSCLQGFKMIFSFDEIQERAQRLYPNSILSNNLTAILNDIYRIGLIGNCLNENTRWEYKGQYKLFIDDNWKMIIHPALRMELSVNSRKDKYINKLGTPVSSITSHINEEYVVRIKQISFKSIRVTFKINGQLQEGNISIYNLGYKKVQEGQIGSLYKVGDTVKAKTISYNSEYSKWQLSIVK